MAARGRPAGPQRIAFPLRAERAILDAVRRCAAADLRSINAQIEVLLREALERRGVRLEAPGADGLSDGPGEAVKP